MGGLAAKESSWLSNIRITDFKHESSGQNTDQSLSASPPIPGTTDTVRIENQVHRGNKGAGEASPLLMTVKDRLTRTRKISDRERRLLVRILPQRITVASLRRTERTCLHVLGATGTMRDG